MGDSDFARAVRQLVEDALWVDVRPGLRVRAVAEAALSAAGGSAAPDAAGGSAAPDAKRRLEQALLEAGVVPRRYLRNLGTIGLEGQRKLLGARVGVAGLGGLGGLAAELLARAGVGELVLVDPDIVSDDNLNRQLLATEANLGQSKVEAARQRLSEVNSATTVLVHQQRGDAATFREFFAGVSAVVDALDTVPARLDLQDAARHLGVPLIHGAIAGWSGQVTTVFPGDPGLETLYGPRETAAERGVEALVGNLSPTPALVAAAQVQEVIKALTGIGQPLRRKLLILDAQSPYATIVDL